MNRSRMLQSLLCATEPFPYPENGLVSYWRLDEDPAIHNTVIEDSFGSNNGTLITNDGSTNKSVTGQVGKAIDFDGVDDYIDAGNIFPSGDFTFCAWITTDAFFDDFDTTNMKIFGVGTGASDTILLYPNSTVGSANGNLRVFALGVEILVGSDIKNTGWRHITLTRSSNTWTLYVDAIFDAQAIRAGTQNSNLEIGKTTFQSAKTIDSIMDDITLYNRALSHSEIQQIYNFGA